MFGCGSNSITTPIANTSFVLQILISVIPQKYMFHDAATALVSKVCPTFQELLTLRTHRTSVIRLCFLRVVRESVIRDGSKGIGDC